MNYRTGTLFLNSVGQYCIILYVNNGKIQGFNTDMQLFFDVDYFPVDLWEILVE